MSDDLANERKAIVSLYAQGMNISDYEFVGRAIDAYIEQIDAHIEQIDQLSAKDKTMETIEIELKSFVKRQNSKKEPQWSDLWNEP